MLENNNVGFDFDYDEDETIDHLKALSTVRCMFERSRLQKIAVGDDESRDDSAISAVDDMTKSLSEYGESKDYDLKPYTMYALKSAVEVCRTPEYKAYEQYMDDACRRLEAKMEGADTIDESQFEMPEQNQRTL